MTTKRMKESVSDDTTFIILTFKIHMNYQTLLRETFEIRLISSQTLDRERGEGVGGERKGVGGEWKGTRKRIANYSGEMCDIAYEHSLNDSK